MKRVGLFAVVPALALAVVAVGSLACNGLLGISSASLEIVDAGGLEAGLTCAYYCQQITQNCTGNSVEYQGDMSLCAKMCNDMALDDGTISAAGQNTLGCRIYYAQQAAAADAVTNCRFAGPLGGGMCGDKTSACANFCSIDVPYCKAVGAPSYLTDVECTNHCLGIADVADAGTGYPFLTDGGASGIDLPDNTDTLNCRYYHLENGYPTAARGTVHCPHTMPISATCN